MKTPRWITWDKNGECWMWDRKPTWGRLGFWDVDVSGDCCTGVDALDRKRGGPTAIRRIRLEKP